MSAETINFVNIIMNTVSDRKKPEWREILNFVENWPESQNGVVYSESVQEEPALDEKEKEIAKIMTFSQDGTLSPAEESISVTKQQIWNYFNGEDRSKKSQTRTIRPQFVTALAEALIHFESNHSFIFTKTELTFNKNINLRSVSDKTIMQLLDKRYLKTYVKEDAVEIIKNYVLIMNLLESQPKGEKGQLPNNGYYISMDYIKLYNNEMFSLLISFRRDEGGFFRIWLLSSFGPGVWPERCYFLSRPETKKL